MVRLGVLNRVHVVSIVSYITYMKTKAPLKPYKRVLS